MILTSEDRNKLILVLLWVVFGLVVYFRLLLGPQLSKLGSLGQDVRSLKRRITSLDVMATSKTALEREHQELSEMLSGHKDVIVREGQNVKLLKDLSARAESRDVQIISMREVKGNRPVKKLVKVVPVDDAKPDTEERLIEVKMICGYHEFGTFLNDVERMTPVLKVVNMEIRPSAEDAYRHQATLLVRSFTADKPDEN